MTRNRSRHTGSDRPGPLRRLVSGGTALLLVGTTVVGVVYATDVATAPPSKADPYSSPQTYSAQANSDITDFSAAIPAITGNLTIVQSISTANSAAQAKANVQLLQGSLQGVTVPLTAASQTAPPDHTTPATAGLNNFGVPNVFTIDALAGTALAHGYASACPTAAEANPAADPDLAKFTQAPGHPPVFAAGSRVLSKSIGKMSGFIALGGLLGNAGAFTNYDVTSLVPTGLGADSYGIQSTSTAEVAGITFLNGAIGFTWSGFYPYVKAVATGVPGGASTDYALPAVQVTALGVVQNLSPGQTYGYTVPLVGGLTVTVGQPTLNVASADGTHAEITVPLLNVTVTLLGLASVTYQILPMHAVANMTAGATPGIQCAPSVSGMTPVQGPTSGGQTVTITGQNFAQGATTVTIGGITVPATVAADGKSLTFVTPAHAEGPVAVSVTTPEGTVAAPTYTYIPPTPVITGPANGSTATTPTPPITGTGYPGSTETVKDENGVTVCTATVTAAGTWTCTPTAPFAPGSHTLTDTQVSPLGNVSTSPPDTFTYVPAPVITGPTSGSTTGTTPTITGTGYPGSTITVQDGGTTVCTATVQANGTWSCVPTAPLPVGPNTITATQVAPNGNTQPSNPDTFTVANVAITMTKTGGAVNDLDGNGTDVGDTIVYTFKVTNSGGVAVSNIKVSDPKISPTPFTCLAGSLAPGLVATCTATYVLTQTDVDAATINNTATATATGPGSSTATATASATTPVTGSTGQLVTTKTGVLNDTNHNSVADLGETITYTITTKNAGTLTESNVSVSDPKLPSLSCSVASLAPNGQLVCTGTYTVTQGDVDAGKVVNTATASGTLPGGGASPTTPGTWTINANTADGLTTTKTAALVTDANHNGLPDVGDTIMYTITTKNTGAQTLTNVTTSDPMLPSLTCTPAQGAALAPGAVQICTGVYTVTQGDVDSGAVNNTATTNGTTPGGVLAPTSPGSSTVATNSTGKLVTTKTAALVTDANHNGLPDVGDTIKYTITTTNQGTETISHVTTTDAMLPSLSCTPGQDVTLAPQGVQTCTGTYTVTQADVDTGHVSNTATATGATPSGGVAPATPGSVDTSTDSTASLVTTKTAALVTDANHNGLPDVGDTIEYTITTTNQGTETIKDVIVSDPKIPAAALSCTPAQGSTLAPGGSVVCQGVYTVTQADVDTGHVSNTATATGTTPNGGAAPTTPGSVDVQADTKTGLQTTKTAVLHDPNGNTEAEVGDTIDYTITTTNIGAVTVKNVVVSDPNLPGAQLSCTPGQDVSLGEGESIVCHGTYTVTQTDVDSGSVVNTATAAGTLPGGGAAPTAPGTSTITADTTAHLQTTKTAAFVNDANHDGKADVGDTIRYTITTTNIGALTVKNVVVSDPKLPGAQLSCTPGQDATLASGESVLCQGVYTVTQTDVDSGSVVNTATATGNGPDGVAAPSDPGTSTVLADTTAHLTTSKSAVLHDSNGNNRADLGETITYTVATLNDGAVSVSDVVVSDPLLPGAALSCTPAQGTKLAAGESIVCMGTYTVTQADVDSGAVSNTATATGTVPGNQPVLSVPGTSIIPTTTAGELTTTKTAVLHDANGDTKAVVGNTITYTITTTNTGARTVDNVTVRDPKLPGAALTCAPTLPVATLAPTKSVICTGTYTVTQADVDAGAVENTATAAGSMPGGGAAPSEPGSSTVPTDSTARLTTSKSAVLNDTNGNALADAGETITYTITTRNTGDVTITGVSVSDPKLPGAALTCDPAGPTTLLPGGVIVCTGTYTVTEADVKSGLVSNTATASGTLPGGGAAPSSPGTATIPTDVPPPATGSVAGSSTLAQTGVGLGPQLIVVALSIAFGLMLLLAGRRRRTSS